MWWKMNYWNNFETIINYNVLTCNLNVLRAYYGIIDVTNDCIVCDQKKSLKTNDHSHGSVGVSSKTSTFVYFKLNVFTKKNRY